MGIFDIFKKIESERRSPDPIAAVLAGLGNPGRKYLRNRHNAGYMFVDYMMQKHNFPLKTIKFKSIAGECVLGGKRTLVIKPQTFMNNSGEAVRQALDFYKLTPADLLIVYDDIALPAGAMRIRRKGSAGGHNGIKSIISHLATEDFTRIKLGVGTPPDGCDLVNWVLGDIPAAEQKSFFETLGAADLAAEQILRGDIDGAMNNYNRNGEK